MNIFKHKSQSISMALITLVTSLQFGNANADDIDIYSVPPTALNTPTVMFALDNTPNWSRNSNNWTSAGARTTCLAKGYSTEYCTQLVSAFFGSATSVEQGVIEVRALQYVINSMVCDAGTNRLKVKIGLVLGAKKSEDNNGHNVGVINLAANELDGTRTTAGSGCKAINDQIDKIAAKVQDPAWKVTSSQDYGSMMYEIFKYFGGYTSPDKVAANTAGTAANNKYGPIRFSKPDSALDDPNAFIANSTSTYKSPISNANKCGRSYIVLIGNGFPNLESANPATFATANMSYTPPVIGGGLASNKLRYADEWSYFLANTDVSPIDGVQSVNTFTINVFNGTADADQSLLLKSMAAVGGMGASGYYEVNNDLGGMVAAIGKILTNVAAIDSVFTATSLPVSTTTQGSFINQLFIGMFRPDENARPRWVGNLKQYKLAFDGTPAKNVIVVDKNGDQAIDGSSGFFAATTDSFWTTTSNFFADKPSGTPMSADDAPDGSIVEKGGAAQRLRNKFPLATAIGNRNILTVGKGVTSQSAATFPTLSTSTHGTNGTNSSTIALTPAQISWIKGQNNVPSGDGSEYLVGKDASDNALDIRASIHGDILHSRPSAVNFGKDANDNDNIVVFYGTNDGLLHAIDGRQTTSGGGDEYWSFMPPEMYENVARVRSQSPEILLPVNSSTGSLSTSTNGSTPRMYGVDGNIGTYVAYQSNGTPSKVMIYSSLRRGGEAIYAFDVTNTTAINGEKKPTLVWAIRSSNANFTRLGQTWSTPKAVILNSADYPKVSGVTQNVVAVFGAGYDPLEDNPTATTSATKGHAVYVVDALTGTRRIELTGSGSDAITGAVVSDISVVDTNFDGKFDRMYFGDVKGGVYRVDIGADFSSWPVKKIAQLTGEKIFHAPDVVATKDFVTVLVGTGDREKPLTSTSANGFYLIKDTLKTQNNTATIYTKTHLRKIASVGTDGIITTVTETDGDLANGCYVALGTNGEKVVNTPFSIAGTTYFGTNTPIAPTVTDGTEDESCKGSLGAARAYNMDLFCAVPRSYEITSGGYPPSPVGGLVTIDGELTPFVIGAGNTKSAFEAKKPTPTVESIRKKNYWKIIPNKPGSK